MTAHFAQPDPEIFLRYAVWVGTVAFFAISIWYIVQLAFLLLTGPNVEIQIDRTPVARQSVSNSLPSEQQIASWHLFGESPVNDPLLFDTLPETPLDLELRGIVAGESSDKTGKAIIIDSSGNEGVYNVGDSLADNTEVIAIQPHQVVLQRGATREALSLPLHDGVARNSSNRTSQVATSQRPTPATSQGIQIGEISNFRGLRGPAAGGLAPVNIAGMNVTDFSALAKSVRVTPVTGGGFRVFPGRDATVFRQLGLQANDVLTAVNGQPLTNVQAAMQIFQQTDNVAGITISVRRGNQVIQLQPDVSALGK